MHYCDVKAFIILSYQEFNYNWSIEMALAQTKMVKFFKGENLTFAIAIILLGKGSIKQELLGS